VFAHYVRIVLLHRVHASLIPVLIASDQQSYRNYFRMDYDSFTLLLDKVHPMLQRQDTVMQASILLCAEKKAFYYYFIERLSVTYTNSGNG